MKKYEVKLEFTITDEFEEFNNKPIEEITAEITEGFIENFTDVKCTVKEIGE